MDYSNKYVNEFFSLTCMPDILDILSPISGKKKEISESMAVIKQIRKIVMKKPKTRFLVFDFCAGNALTSTLANFLYPNVSSYAIDKAVRDRDWDMIKRFMYIKSNIYKKNWEYTLHQQRVIYPRTKFIIIGVHPCGELSKRIIEIYNKSKADHLIIMPCCTGGKYKFSLPQVITEKVGNYLTWCMYLLNLVEGRKRLIVDEGIISPKNALIIARRG